MIRVLRVVRIARVRGTWRWRCQPIGPGETTVLLGARPGFKGRTLRFLGGVDSSPILEKMNLVDAIFFQMVD